MWESPIYKLNQPFGRDPDDNLLYKQIVIDVTRSAPSFAVPGKAMTRTLKEALRIAKVGPKETILDFGAGKLRNTIYLLKGGYRVCAVEFEHQFARSEKAKGNLVLAEQTPGRRFSKMVYPHEFKKSDLKVKLILLINVINIMPIPTERLLVLQQCHGKLKQGGYLLWYTHRGDQSYKSRQVEEYQIGDGHYIGKGVRLKTFYKEYPVAEIDALMSQAGFEFVKTIRAATWRNQARLFQKAGSTALSKIVTSKLIDKGYVVDESIQLPKKVKPKIVKSRVCKIKGNPNPDSLALEELLIRALGKIKKVSSEARTFEKLVMKMFERLFPKELGGFRLEKSKNGSAGQDVVADVRGKEGFFHKLKTEYKLRFSSVVVECRNLRYKVDDPAFQELGGRCGLGGFGILAYREGVHAAVVKLCRRILFQQNRIILPINDNDMAKLLEFRKKSQHNRIGAYLRKLLTEIIQPGKVFVSYSRKDRKYLIELQEQLADLARRGLVSLWDDTQMRTGEIWRMQIKEAIDSVKVAVFLVSRHFQASDFIAEHEVKPLLAARKAEKVQIFPVMVRPVLPTPELAQLQFANDMNKPLSGMNPLNRDLFWVQLVKQIKDALN